MTLPADDITQAVLGNDDVARHVRDAGSRGRLRGYLDELRTTQRYRIYRALQHPLYPILRRIERIAEHVEHARAATAGRKRPFSREVPEMVRHAIGYQSRAFVTFGAPIPLSEYDPAARRDLVALAHRIQHEVGLLHKVLPTALVAAALRASMTRSELAARIDDLLALFSAQQANLAVTSGRQAVDEGVERLVNRGVLMTERQQVQVRDRMVLEYYARTLEHLMPLRRSTH